jgi:hypothetical protein
MKNSPLNYGMRIHNPKSNLKRGIAGRIYPNILNIQLN